MRDATDPTDLWWSIDTAMSHLKVTRTTILRYLREEDIRTAVTEDELLVNRDDLLAAYRGRIERQRATRARTA